MTELEKIEYAKSFIDKLANGINPLDDSSIPENDIANNVRLSRCFFYVSDILRQVIENGGVRASKKEKHHKKEFSLTTEERSKIQLSEIPLTVSEISNHLNSLVNLETTKKISASSINKWLLNFQFLELVSLSNGKNRKIPTEQGREIGIFAQERSGPYGQYTTILFSIDAQRFIYDNIEAIVHSTPKEKKQFPEFQGLAWSKNHDECLIDLFQKNVAVSEIAITLKRSEEGVRARLKRLGLIEKRSDAK